MRETSTHVKIPECILNGHSGTVRLKLTQPANPFDGKFRGCRKPFFDEKKKIMTKPSHVLSDPMPVLSIRLIGSKPHLGQFSCEA